MTRAGRALRDQWKGDRLGAENCPRCGHQMDGHRGMPSECIGDPACKCVVKLDDLTRWRSEGRLST